MKKRSLYKKRITYTGKKLPAAHDPFSLFTRWFNEAIRKAPDEPQTMALATASKAGRPSVRMLLLKSFSRDGFVFFTNFGSRKASEMAENPHGSICFYWAGLHHQVRIEGKLKKVSAAEADRYFATRPRGSQLAAWASLQSSPLRSSSLLEERFNGLAEQYKGKKIPRPPFWGGYCLVPSYFEFWSGKPNRLHERTTFVKKGGGWVQQRLYP